MPDDEYSEEEEATEYDLYTSTLDYKFDPHPYSVTAGEEAIEEDEHLLAAEIKRFYPELIDWEVKALTTAWRSYSRDVCLIDEEYVCVRTPDFLAYLFVIQEGWDPAGRPWLGVVQEAVNILWPLAADIKGVH